MSVFYGWDLVIHGSDIARATGQVWTVRDDEAAELHAIADGWGARCTQKASARVRSRSGRTHS